MLTAFIVILIIVLLLFIASGALKKRATPNQLTSVNKSSIKVTITESVSGETTDSTINVDVAPNDKKDNNYRSINIEKRELYEKRRYNNWLAYRFLISYYELLTNTTNFYDYEINTENFQRYKQEFLEKGGNMSNLIIAVRYCKLQNYIEECDYEIKHSDIEKIKQWQDFSSKNLSLEDVICKYQSYWDDVLANYKRQSAKTNRLHYLIEQLAEVRSKDYIKNSSELTKRIDELREHYASQL